MEEFTNIFEEKIRKRILEVMRLQMRKYAYFFS